jgi:hypothetical protein
MSTPLGTLIIGGQISRNCLQFVENDLDSLSRASSNLKMMMSALSFYRFSNLIFNPHY